MMACTDNDVSVIDYDISVGIADVDDIDVVSAGGCCVQYSNKTCNTIMITASAISKPIHDTWTYTKSILNCYTSIKLYNRFQLWRPFLSLRMTYI
jgi:hypothetical protein